MVFLKKDPIEGISLPITLFYYFHTHSIVLSYWENRHGTESPALKNKITAHTHYLKCVIQSKESVWLFLKDFKVGSKHPLNSKSCDCKKVSGRLQALQNKSNCHDLEIWILTSEIPVYS